MHNSFLLFGFFSSENTVMDVRCKRKRGVDPGEVEVEAGSKKDVQSNLVVVTIKMAVTSMTLMMTVMTERH